jgi:hypothetical protein
MNKQITAIYISFTGTKPRKRKPQRQVVKVGQFDGHKLLSPDELNDWERKAWAAIEASGIKRTTINAVLNIHHAHEDGEMVFTPLFPKQQQILMKELL